MKEISIQETYKDDRFRQLVEGLPQILYELSEDGLVSYANDFALSRFKLTRNDLENGIHFTEVLHPDSHETAYATIQSAQPHGTMGTELLARSKDGSIFPIKISMQAIVKDGRTMGVRGVAIDLTETRDAETALRKSESYYRALFENTGTAMFIVGRDNIIYSCNSKAEELVGYSASKIMGKMCWHDFVAPEETERLKRIRARRFSGGPTLNDYTFTFLTRDKTRKMIRAIIQLIPETDATVCSLIDITEQHRTTQALRESQERYEQVVRGTNDGVWDWDLKTDNVYYSPRYKAILGYEDHELPNVVETWKDRVHPEDLEITIARNMECVEGKVDTFEVEYRMMHRDGTYRWILGRGTSVKDKSGKVYRLAGTHTDITDRKRTEQALKASEKRLRTIFSTANDGVYRCTPDGRFITANPSMAAILGYDSPDELIKNVSDTETQLYVDPTDRKAFLAALEKEGRVTQYEKLLQRRDGTKIWISENVTATYHDDGTLKHYDGFMQDITTRKISERTTQAMYDISKAISTTSHLQELYETIHAILGEVIDATNFFIAMLDKDRDRLSFSYFADEMDDYYDIDNFSDPEKSSLVIHVMRTGKSLLLSTARPEDKQKWEALSILGTPPAVWLGTPLKIRDQVIGAVAVQHYSNPHHYSETDVAFMEAAAEQIAFAIERKTNEEKLTQLNEQLESTVEKRTAELRDKAEELEAANLRLTELDKIKSALVSSVSHELRTPLTSIRGFAKLAGRDFTRYFRPLETSENLEKKGKRIKQNLSIIETEGERLTRLINDFLDINRMESGKANWHDQFCNPCEIIQQAVNTGKGAFASRPDVTLVADMPATISPIHADPDKIQQVLTNLLNNASKFTEQGEIRVSVTDARHALTISVTDTGIGIPKNEQNTIFDKFQKSSQGDTISTANKGTGLGLAICKEIVEHYGGTIWVDSTPGKGSNFSFTLPALAGVELPCE